MTDTQKTITQKTIGFIGLGVMGREMIRHLAAAGFRLAVHDRDERALSAVAAEIEDAAACAGPADLARESDVVVLMLPDGNVVREVVAGDGGIVNGLKSGGLVIDCSSSQPWLTRESATALADVGARMVDAPVSGAVEGARDAELVFMVGGEEADVARARPILEVMGNRVFHLGPLSSGHIMKTINNLATAITLAGTAEAMLIGRAAGLDPSVMLDVLNVSTGASFVSRAKFGPHVLTGAYRDPFQLALMLKDITIATDLAEEVEIQAPLGAHTRELFSKADAYLGPERSVMEYVRWREELAGKTLAER